MMLSHARRLLPLALAACLALPAFSSTRPEACPDAA